MGEGPSCSTFTQNIHCVPLAEVQILRPSGCVTVPSYYLVEDWSAPGPLWQKGGLQGWHKRGAFPSTCRGWWASQPFPLPHLALEMQPSWAHGHIPPCTLQCILRGDWGPELLSWGLVTGKGVLSVCYSM